MKTSAPTNLMTLEEFRQYSKTGTNPAPGTKPGVRAQYDATVRRSSQEGGLDFVITTSRVDRYSDVVEQQGGSFKTYVEKNPVVLWMHDRMGPPVASTRGGITQEAEGMVARNVQFTPKDLYPFGYMIGQMYDQGFLRSVSIGFIPDEWTYDEEIGGYRFIKWTLLEFSAVTIPANEDALVLGNSFAAAKGAGIDVSPALAWATEHLDKKAAPGLIAGAAAIHKALAPASVQVPRAAGDDGQLAYELAKVRRSVESMAERLDKAMSHMASLERALQNEAHARASLDSDRLLENKIRNMVRETVSR